MLVLSTALILSPLPDRKSPIFIHLSQSRSSFRGGASLAPLYISVHWRLNSGSSVNPPRPPLPPPVFLGKKKKKSQLTSEFPISSSRDVWPNSDGTWYSGKKYRRISLGTISTAEMGLDKEKRCSTHLSELALSTGFCWISWERWKFSPPK